MLRKCVSVQILSLLRGVCLSVCLSYLPGCRGTAASSGRARTGSRALLLRWPGRAAVRSSSCYILFWWRRWPAGYLWERVRRWPSIVRCSRCTEIPWGWRVEPAARSGAAAAAPCSSAGRTRCCRCWTSQRASRRGKKSWWWKFLFDWNRPAPRTNSLKCASWSLRRRVFFSFPACATPSTHFGDVDVFFFTGSSRVEGLLFIACWRHGGAAAPGCTRTPSELCVLRINSIKIIRTVCILLENSVVGSQRLFSYRLIRLFPCQGRLDNLREPFISFTEEPSENASSICAGVRMVRARVRARPAAPLRITQKPTQRPNQVKMLWTEHWTEPQSSTWDSRSSI